MWCLYVAGTTYAIAISMGFINSNFFLLCQRKQYRITNKLLLLQTEEIQNGSTNRTFC